MKFATSILEILDVLYYPVKIFGMAPYIRTVNGRNERKYVQNPRVLKHYLLLFVIISGISASSLLRTYLEVESRTISLFDGIRGFIYVSSQLAGVGKLLELALKQKSFVTCIDLIEQSDKLLKDIGLSVSYKSIHVVLLMLFTMYPVFLFVTVAPIWDVYKETQQNGFFSKTNQVYFAQFINLSMIYVIRFASVYLYTSFAYIATQRLHILNGHLNDVEENEAQDLVLTKNVILVTSDLYHTVMKLIQKINKTFGWAIFSTISLCFVEIIASIVMRGELTESHMALMFFVNIVFATTALAIFFIGEKLNLESNRTGPLLCNLTLPYFNEDLSKDVCSVLYQIPQERTELSAGGFYPINTKTVTSHVGLLSTILMFFLKIRDTLHL